jgi:hypothetical protein
VRDLLRRRMNLVRQRTALMLSFKSLYARTTGEAMTLKRLKEITPKEAPELYEHPANQLRTERTVRLGRDHIAQYGILRSGIAQFSMSPSTFECSQRTRIVK